MVYRIQISVKWKFCELIKFTYFYYTHRKDPVPYASRGNKASGRGCYRRIRTTQERKAGLDLETRHLIRLKRRKMKSAWDDIPYSDWKHNCWKKCTKKKRQWM